MTLNEVMKDTADAIREKTGKSELIKPVDFAEEIRGITTGGGESRGYIFYDQKRIGMNGHYLWNRSSSIKVNMGGQLLILLTGDMKQGILDNNMEDSIVAVCIDPNLKFQLDPDGPLATIFEYDPPALEWINSCRITEEEFYDLNA